MNKSLGTISQSHTLYCDILFLSCFPSFRLSTDVLLLIPYEYYDVSRYFHYSIVCTIYTYPGFFLFLFPLCWLEVGRMRGAFPLLQ